MSKFDDMINSIFTNPRVQIKNSASYWDEVKLCQVASLKNKQENFCTNNRHWDEDTISAFGTAQPAADNYLLHLAPGWQANRNKTPVILIPGAGFDASSFTNLYNLGYEGMQQQLVKMGYKVFGLTFSHSHGDNFYQAEQLADAIERVKALCMVNQVDLLAHSKGGLVARIYLSNLSTTAYRGDVRSLVMLGTPNLGVDFAFRNPSLSLPIYLSGSNGVIPWDRLTYLGTIIDTSPQAIYQDGCFPGQSQMLYRWDDEYPLDVTQADWWTTYHGGQGFISHSRGIDVAINDGGNMIERLERAGIGPDIELSVLAGDNNRYGAITGDSSGPSDGMVFLDSVFNTDAMVARGTKLRNKTKLPLNHLGLLISRRAAMWIHSQLSEA